MLTIEPIGAVLGDTMTISSIKFGRLKLAVAASLMAGALLIGPASRAAGEDAGAQVKSVLAQTLPNVPGKSLTAVIVTYAPGGKSVKHHHAGTMIAERGPDDTSRKPPLAEAFRTNTVDPLSAIERIRGAFRAAGRIGSFMIPVYDGARRFDIVGRILPKQNPSDGVLRAELTLRAIAGFKGETSEDGDPDDAPGKVELSVDEARMVPLSITVPVFSLPLVVQFQRLCAAPDPCT